MHEGKYILIVQVFYLEQMQIKPLKYADNDSLLNYNELILLKLFLTKVHFLHFYL